MKRHGSVSQQWSKVCCRCHRTLAMDKFHRRLRSWDGHQDQCKTCATLYQRDYRAKKAAATEEAE